MEEKSTFVCNICNSKSSSKSSAERHFKLVHSGETPFHCDVCPKQFALKWMLDTHKEMHKSNFVKCDICGKDIISIKMKIHMRNIHENPKETRRVPCNICGLKVKSIAEHLRNHEDKLKNSSKLEKCPICKKEYSFKKGSDLKTHMEKHAQPKRHKCKDCKKFFGHSTTLTTHMRIHTGEKPFSCQKCPAQFYDLAGKNRHERRHLEKTNNKPSGEHIKAIVKSKSTSNKKAKKYKYKCNICENLVGNLKKHMNSHTQSERFDCEHCNKKFCSIYTMQRHITMVHLEVKSFTCQVCPRSFALKFQLKEHEEVHSGLNFDCAKCDKSYKSKKSLYLHVKSIHLPKAQATCEVCKKTLSDRGALQRHKRLIHSTIRPFTCKYCPKTYALRSMMNSHVRDTHERKNV